MKAEDPNQNTPETRPSRQDAEPARVIPKEGSNASQTAYKRTARGASLEHDFLGPNPTVENPFESPLDSIPEKFEVLKAVES